MKAPISWLKDYVDINVDVNTLCDKMVAIGLEIEEVIDLSATVKGVVIGQVVTITQHPNADRLRCITLDIGSEIIPIVTNDHNIKVGDKVPVALDKAVLADGLVIKAGKMRGEESRGMLCGYEELGINSNMYHSNSGEGVLVLKDSAVVGGNIIDEVGLNDYIIDVGVTSNRQDCNSIYGLAREISVALGTTLRSLDTTYTTIDSKTTEYVSVDVQDTYLCPNYYMQGIVDVVIAKSPEWMSARLTKCGHNAINNIVDITNYCLVEVGQPMHAFDYRQLSDQQIVVRRAKTGESLVALDNKEYKLYNNHLVIANATAPIGLAGIMGGSDSGIKNDTNIVMFECARFARENIRHSSRELSLRSDSSARFEKGIDDYTTRLALDRALHLVQQLNCANILSCRIDATESSSEPQNISFDLSEVQKLLGISIDTDTIKNILSSLQFVVTINNNTISCIVPPYRDDCSRACDIIEEIIRVYGYDNIVGTLMNDINITHGGKNRHQLFTDGVKNTLLCQKYSEAIFYPFAGKALFDKIDPNKDYDVSNNIRLINPIGEELSLMNRTIVANMLQCVANNHAKKNTDVKLFEVGKVYLADSLPLTQLPVENNRLCMANSCCDFDKFRDDILNIMDCSNISVQLVRSDNKVLHPGVSADIMYGNTVIGSFGKLHPQIAKNYDINIDTYIADIDMDILYSLYNQKFQFVNLSKYQPITRDIAVVVEEDIAQQDLIDTALSSNKLIASAKVFDIFRSDSLGENKKSVAIAITLAPRDHQLSDKEIDKVMTRLLDVLKQSHGAVLR